jgi:Na+-transporting methylmalonyl-CoA/oxaloacetate decarboxylase gamma subunit
MNIDWNIVTQIAGLGFLVLFIVVGALALVVWVVNLLVRRIFIKKLPTPAPNNEVKGAQ